MSKVVLLKSSLCYVLVIFILKFSFLLQHLLSQFFKSEVLLNVSQIEKCNTLIQTLKRHAHVPFRRKGKTIDQVVFFYKKYFNSMMIE